MTIMNKLNRKTYSNFVERRFYKTNSGFLNPGEYQVFMEALVHCGGGRVLDMGVGGGRTTALLNHNLQDYVGIDYSAAMIEIAQQNHPDARFQQMDARDLSAFPDGYFDLVVFSNNGIDSVDVEGRAQVMSEARRVLKSNGVFVFSTFHANWSGFQKRWTGLRMTFTYNPIQLAGRFAMALVGLARRKYYARFEITNADYLVRLHPAHHFGILIYASTPDNISDQLRTAGFGGLIKIVPKSGNALTAESAAREEYLNVLAYKS